MDERKLLFQATSIIRRFDAPIPARGCGAVTQAAIVNKVTPDSKAELSERIDKVEAHNFDGDTVGNQKNELCLLLKRFQAQNVTLHSTCSTEKSPLADTLIVMTRIRLDKDVLGIFLGKVRKHHLEILAVHRRIDNFK